MLELKPGPAAIAAPPSTILVVDDNPVNLQVLVRTLDGQGHRILVAKTGHAALEIARRVRPNLVLLDVMMPDLGGFEVCRALKADPAMKETAVIFLSALGDVEDKVSGLTLGAVDYITKPIQPEEVQVRVSNHLTRLYLERELRRSRDRLDRELAKAARLQQQLLPRALPSHPALALAPFYRTSRHAGGDYYDVLDLGRDRFAVIVADVSGHGASAAIVMAMIRSVLHTPSGCSDDPGEVLGYLNRHFDYLREDAIFATAAHAVIDLNAGTVRVACAGHPPPLLLRDGEPVRPLPVEATMPLLLMDIDRIPSSELALQSGDRFLFYTDGITDRENDAGMPYDVERLAAAFDSSRRFPPAAAVTGLVADLELFARGREADDDQTLLLVECAAS
jgi:sigma-B regulation protein RsbU (phosphoserine phosphatase)